MNKAVLIDTVAGELGITKKRADEVVVTVLQGLMAGTVEDGECAINGFGKFFVKDIPERQGVNPQTGESITVAAHKKICFKPFSIFKESVAAI
jgi:Bacterial nucleoid DNA-binding protein